MKNVGVSRVFLPSTEGLDKSFSILCFLIYSNLCGGRLFRHNWVLNE